MLIRVRGKVFVYDDDENEIDSHEQLAKLVGIQYKDDAFTNYMDSDMSQMVQPGGFITISQDANDGGLRCVTEYHSVRDLTDAEIEALVSYTTGQWSDGIGSGFHDWTLDEYGCAIDCSLMSQDFMTIHEPEVETIA